MSIKRKLAKCSPIGFMGLVAIFLIIIGSLTYYYYHNVFDKFLGPWLIIIGLSLFIIENSRDFNKITRSPNIVRRYKTTPAVKRLVISFCILLLSLIIIVGIMVLWFFGRLVFSGNIANPIYDLMFATAFIVYIIAASYGTWWGKEAPRANA